ncbi:MAG: ABC transporter permease [Bacteroidales bacterium]|nr:ABC transporter permease [Bacteroidales bacterium]
MNLELFIAKRIHFTKGNEERKVSPPAIRIAIAGIAIGLAVMILSVSIVVGFKNEVRAKVIGFGSHIQISNFDNNTTFETIPIGISDSLIGIIKKHPEISNIERFATKPGIIKTDSSFMAIVIKGVGNEYNWDFFKKNLIEGDIIHFNDSTASNDILVSKSIADKMNLKLGDSFMSYFIENSVRQRKFKVAGIYQTNFTDYDKLFVIGDLRHVQKLNFWAPDQVSGLEILVNNYDETDRIAEELYFDLLQNKDKYGSSYYARSIKQLNPQIFSWLDLLNTNVWVILILMALVSSFTMISGLLIIILERTNMIGILKALGYKDSGIQRIFLNISFFLILKGLMWGNIIGIGLALIQRHFKWFKLDPESYYIDAVPIELNIFHVILLNIATIIIALLVLLGPSYVITKISPVKAIRFE